ncbi:MAG: prolipoprotein diacylglyceryl transferase family protein [Holosporaceae bacterium]|jgi:phosphatidylglycerol:prolipoprotein diacylglycerol transferase
MLTYPEIDPIALQLGPIAIRWYALSYLLGIVLAWRYAIRLSKHAGPRFLLRSFWLIIAFCGLIAF